jgi:hypothetical protein
MGRGKDLGEYKTTMTAGICLDRSPIKSAPLEQSTTFDSALSFVQITSAPSMSNRATFLETAKGEFSVRDADLVEPGQGEVLVKVQYHHLSMYV